MDGPLLPPRGRGFRGAGMHTQGPPRGRGQSRNKHWSASSSPSRPPPSGHSDSERWERGGHRGGVRGFRGGNPRGGMRGFPNKTLRVNHFPQVQEFGGATTTGHFHEHSNEIEEDVQFQDEHEDYHIEEAEAFLEQQLQQHEALVDEGEGYVPQVIHEPELETPEEREKFWKELVKAREAERAKAIAEGKMDDPLVPKRLEDAITIVGTCMDMCPRFERYRRERENNLFEWETIPGTKRVDHNRAVKMYERAVGDKVIPSDLRPPPVLKHTLNYLFHDLLARGGFSATHTFIRDRSRAVRNDFTMQHITGPSAIECYDRCARFHILALHIERDTKNFSAPLEEQQLMNTLQSLKEFWLDQRKSYQAPSELEMRVYHRLIHIRNQKERPEDIPEHISNHPVYKLTTDFRLHVQAKSAPITKTSALVVDAGAMEIFSQLGVLLREMGNNVMVYLVACILEKQFGRETIDNIESLRGDLTLPDIIDGVSRPQPLMIQEVQSEEVEDVEFGEEGQEEGEEVDDVDDFLADDGTEYPPANGAPAAEPTPAWPTTTPSAFSSLATATSSAPPPSTGGAFGNLVSQPSIFGPASVFGAPVASTSSAQTSAFSNIQPTPSNIFGGPSFPSVGASAPAPPAPSIFGSSTTSIFGSKPATPTPPQVPTPAAPATVSSIFASNNVFATNGSSVSLGSKPPTPATQPFPKPPSLNPKAPIFTPPGFPTSSPPAPAPSATAMPAPTPPPPQPVAFPPPISQPDNRSTFTFTPPKAVSNPFAEVKSSTSTIAPVPPTMASTPAPQEPPRGPDGRRLSAPPLLKIDTNTSTSSSVGSQSQSQPSPRVPPAAPKQIPIPLPSTPTVNPLLGHIRQSLDSFGSASPSSSTPDVLSPLVMASPSASRPFNNFSPLATPRGPSLRRRDSDMSFLSLAAPPPITLQPPPKSRLKDKTTPKYDEEAEKALESKAIAFEQRSAAVKQAFGKWLKRVMDKAAYLEACRQSDAYRERIQNGERAQASPRPVLARSQSSGDRKRRMSSSTNVLSQSERSATSPVKKRARKRISAEYRPPRTDEDLAKRLQENQAEHEQRWAQGSFLRVVRQYVQNTNPAAFKLPWYIWLSTNPGSDATAIWVDRKFDVPDSGFWLSDIVFSMPLPPDKVLPPSSNFPGLIVFECTPLGDCPDELERKYRVLDDCSRLRDLIKALPSGRYFVPSLLVISWSSDGSDLQQSDFTTMLDRLVKESTIQGFHTFNMTSTTTDLDNKLTEALKTLSPDTEGKLAQMLSVDEAFKLFEDAYTNFVNEWIDNCASLGSFHWNLYGQTVQACVAILNGLSQTVHELLQLQGSLKPLPSFDFLEVDDSDTLYDDAREWLDAVDSPDAAGAVSTDIQSYRNLGQDFPPRVFTQHLFHLALDRFQKDALSRLTSSYRSTNPSFPVLTARVESALQAFQDGIRPYHLELLQVYNFTARRSPKRRNAYSIASSDRGSPESSKRPRLSDSLQSGASSNHLPGAANGHREESPSPAPSITSIEGSEVSMATTTGPAAPSTPPAGSREQRPAVTVAMLRALTQDMKRKYIKS